MPLLRRRLLWLLLLPVVLAAAWLILRGRGEAQAFTTGSVDRGDVVEVVGATGALEAVTTVQIGSQVSGTIQSLYADFNSAVRKDQVIARLDPALFEARLGQAQANLVAARANADRARATVEDTRLKFERARELAAQSLLPQSDLDTAKANHDGALAAQKASEAAVSQAVASVNQARLDLSHTVIATPIDGVVISRNVDVGQTVAASFQAPVLFVIANDLTRMRVNASVDEADVGRVREGQDVLFHVDAYPERDFWGRVEQVRLNPTTVSNVVTYNTIVAVENPRLLLRPGMTATVSFQVRKAENVLRLPAAALRFRPEGYERPRGGPAGTGSRPAGAGAGASAARGEGEARPGPGAPAVAAPSEPRDGGPAQTSGSEGDAGRRSGPRGERRGPSGWRAERAGTAGGPGPAAAGAERGASGGAEGWGGPGARRGRPTTVFILGQDRKPRPVEITVGISDGQFVEAREGLKEGALVITGTEIPGAPRASGPRGASPSTNPFSPQRPQRRAR
jgi:HlyD family secretion protein